MVQKKTKKKHRSVAKTWSEESSAAAKPTKNRITARLFSDMSSGYIMSVLSEVSISLIPRQSAYICCSAMVK